MKFITKKPEYGKNVYEVELTDEETKLSDQELVTLADNNGKPNQPVCHFGGKVTRKQNNKATIEVWID